MANGAAAFAQTLVELGVRRVFTLVGDHLNEALSALALAGIEIVHMRHESGVTHAADAHARITRKPSFALVTGGPGHTNALTGLATAHLACSPLILVSGSRSTLMADKQSFQDMDQVGMARPVTKWSAEVPSASQIPFYLRRAYRDAGSGRQGAVHLTIPLNVFQGETSQMGQPSVCSMEPAMPNRELISRCLEQLRSAQRPVVIAGSGVYWSDAGRELRAFIERTNLPLYTITMARGVVRDDHPLCFGYADPALNRAAHAAFQEADLFLVLGKRIDYRLGFGSPRVIPAEAKVIQVDIHPQEFGMNRAIDLAIHADAKTTLAALGSGIGEERWPRLPWLERLDEMRRGWREHLREQMEARGEPMHPAAFYQQLLRALPPETRFCWDGGDFTHWGRSIFPALHDGGWLRLGPLGTIGSALPNAIAFKLEHPEVPVAMITGDGSLGFYIAEMDTAVRYKLPILFIVGNDAGWGLERELQNAQGTLDAEGSTVACELRATRYDLVMKGFGGDGETIHSLDEVEAAVRRGLACEGPYCLNVNVRGVRSPFTDWQIEGKRQAPGSAGKRSAGR